MTEPAALLGTLINDRYRLTEIVGRGGMAYVFKAEDEPHKRTVAIKVFRADAAKTGVLDRFAKEIAILATLQHPNILPLLDSGTVADSPFYVMPFVQGESLRERIVREGRLPIPDAVRLLIELADAIRYAHEHDVIHRDIKPENVLLAGRHALLADFGIARTARLDAGAATTAGLALGTPAYMAPEQAAADPDLDERVDLYALGIVAHEMLAGTHPFAKASPAAMLTAQLTETAPPLDEIRLDVPRGLAAAVTKCLAKRREDRWATAGDLHQALEPFATSSGAMTPVSVAPVKRSGLGWLLAGAVAVGAAAVWFALASSSTAPLTVTTTRRLEEGGELTLDPEISPDGRLVAYAAGRVGAFRIYVKQTAGGDPIEVAREVPGDQRLPRWLPDGTGLLFQAGGSVWRVPALGGAASVLIEGSPEQPAESPAVAPNGADLAYTQGAEIRVRALTGGVPRVVIRDGAAHSLAWDLAGRRLAYVTGNREFTLGDGLLGNVAPSQIRIVSSDGGQPVAVTDGRSLAVAPTWWDDRTLVFVSNQGGVRDVYAATLARAGALRGRPVRLTTGLDAHSVRRSGDGVSLAVGILHQISNLWRMPLVAGRVATMADATPVTTGDQIVEDVDVLAAAGWIAFDSNREGNQDLYILGPNSRRPLQVTRDSVDEFGPTWSPNGKELAYYAVRNGVRHLYVVRPNGSGIRQVTNDSLQDQQPHWSPDGQALVFYRRDNALVDRLFLIRRGADSSWGAPTLLLDEPATAATWSSDGGSIAFVDRAGRVRLIGPDGQGDRVVATPERVGNLPLRRPQWIPFEPALLVRTQEPGGQGSIWRIDLVSGGITEVARFDDPELPSVRDDYATNGEGIYFTVGRFETALWLLELGRKR